EHDPTPLPHLRERAGRTGVPRPRDDVRNARRVLLLPVRRLRVPADLRLSARHRALLRGLWELRPAPAPHRSARPRVGRAQPLHLHGAGRRGAHPGAPAPLPHARRPPVAGRPRRGPRRAHPGCGLRLRRPPAEPALRRLSERDGRGAVPGGGPPLSQRRHRAQAHAGRGGGALRRDHVPPRAGAHPRPARDHGRRRRAPHGHGLLPGPHPARLVRGVGHLPRALGADRPPAPLLHPLPAQPGPPRRGRRPAGGVRGARLHRFPVRGQRALPPRHPPGGPRGQDPPGPAPRVRAARPGPQRLRPRRPGGVLPQEGRIEV
ncbi:MAG: hypothetical protein AVDCRST_MAG68-773, partial [uncultured Gemmatimonadetes bacterium]